VETEDEGRFLFAQANHFTGVKWKEKSSACSVRNYGIAPRRRDERQEGMKPGVG
jgi:hypothetical protein